MTDQEIIDKIIKYRGRFRSQDKIAQGMAQMGRFSYDRCLHIVRRVEVQHRRQIGWRQLPIVLVIGVPSFIIGCVLLVLGIVGLANVANVMRWRLRLVILMITTGAGLIGGSFLGIWVVVRKLI